MERSEILLKDGTKYFYTTSNYDAENASGIVKTTLKQFAVYKTDSAKDVVCNLYQTNEGNWYDLTLNNTINSYLLSSIKIAIDESQHRNHLLNNHIQTPHTF